MVPSHTAAQVQGDVVQMVERSEGDEDEHRRCDLDQQKNKSLGLGCRPRRTTQRVEPGPQGQTRQHVSQDNRERIRIVGHHADQGPYPQDLQGETDEPGDEREREKSERRCGRKERFL